MTLNELINKLIQIRNSPSFEDSIVDEEVQVDIGSVFGYVYEVDDVYYGKPDSRYKSDVLVITIDKQER